MRNPGNDSLTPPQQDRHPGLVPGFTVPSGQGWEAQADRKVVPMRIRALDQVHLPVAPPPLDPLFARDGIRHGVRHVELDEAIHRVSTGEAVENTVAVLAYSRHQIRRHTDVQGVVEAAGQNVDARMALSHALQGAAAWMPEQVRHDGSAVAA